jgi:phage shock protein E
MMRTRIFLTSFLLLACVITGSACDSKSKTRPHTGGADTKASTQPAEPAEPAVARKLIIDVRTPGEFSDDHIADAINIPYDMIGAKIGDLGVGKDREIVLYCRSGWRAGAALATLKRLRYANVTNAGGLVDIRKKMSNK